MLCLIQDLAEEGNGILLTVGSAKVSLNLSLRSTISTF